jgi:hypothetical protein
LFVNIANLSVSEVEQHFKNIPIPTSKNKTFNDWLKHFFMITVKKLSFVADLILYKLPKN